MANEYLQGEGPGRPSVDKSAGRASTKQQIADLEGTIAEDAEAARAALAEGGEMAAEKVEEIASERANFAAHQLSGVGEALEKAGRQMEGGDQPDVGRYARQVGSRVRGFAERMEGKDAGEIAAMAEEFGRRQPLAFMGIATLAGLAASRFLMASAGPSKKSHSARPSGSGRSTADNGGDRHG